MNWQYWVVFVGMLGVDIGMFGCMISILLMADTCLSTVRIVCAIGLCSALSSAVYDWARYAPDGCSTRNMLLRCLGLALNILMTSVPIVLFIWSIQNFDQQRNDCHNTSFTSWDTLYSIYLAFLVLNISKLPSMIYLEHTFYTTIQQNTPLLL